MFDPKMLDSRHRRNTNHVCSYRRSPIHPSATTECCCRSTFQLFRFRKVWHQTSTEKMPNKNVCALSMNRNKRKRPAPFHSPSSLDFFSHIYIYMNLYIVHPTRVYRNYVGPSPPLPPSRGRQDMSGRPIAHHATARCGIKRPSDSAASPVSLGFEGRAGSTLTPTLPALPPPVHSFVNTPRVQHSTPQQRIGTKGK